MNPCGPALNSSVPSASNTTLPAFRRTAPMRGTVKLACLVVVSVAEPRSRGTARMSVVVLCWVQGTAAPVRAPSQMNPLPTVLQVSNDGGRREGLPDRLPGRRRARALASVNVARAQAMIAGPLMSDDGSGPRNSHRPLAPFGVLWIDA